MKRASLARRNPKYLSFIRSMPCAVGCLPIGPFRQMCSGPTHAHHVRTAATSGMGLKPADLGNTVPLCAAHHSEYHQIGRRTFEARYCVDLTAEAALLAQLSIQEMP